MRRVGHAEVQECAEFNRRCRLHAAASTSTSIHSYRPPHPRIHHPFHHSHPRNPRPFRNYSRHRCSRTAAAVVLRLQCCSSWRCCCCAAAGAVATVVAYTLLHHNLACRSAMPCINVCHAALDLCCCRDVVERGPNFIKLNTGMRKIYRAHFKKYGNTRNVIPDTLDTLKSTYIALYCHFLQKMCPRFL